MERLHPGYGKVIAALLLHRSHLLTQGFRRIERGYLPFAALQEVVGKTAAEALVQLRNEIEAATARRSAYILSTTGKYGIQLLAVGSCDILHIGNILQPPFYLQRRSSGIQQVFQNFTLIQVFQRKQVLVTYDCFSVSIYQAKRKAAELCALPPIGTSAETRLTDVALATVTHTKRTMHKDLQRRLRTSLVDIAYLVQ